MTKILKFTLPVALLMIFSTGALANESKNATEHKEKRSLIKTNPIGLLLGTYSIAYDFAFKEKLSLGLAYENAYTEVDGIEGNAQLISVSGKYYTKGFNAKYSTFFAYQMGLLDITARGKINEFDVDFDAKGNGYISSIAYGAKFTQESGITYGASLGIAYSNFNLDGEYQAVDKNQTDRINLTDLGGIAPFVDFSVGYQF